MKHFVITAALAGSLASAIAAQPQLLLPNRRFQAVILPAETLRDHGALTNYYRNFWTPTPADVSRAEKRMADFFAADAAKRYPSGLGQSVLEDIREHPEKFVRQYFGATRAGERVIVCNALPASMSRDWLRGWRGRYVGVADYAGVWHFEYAPSKNRIVWFRIDQGY